MSSLEDIARRYHRLFERAPVPGLVIDRTGKIETANAAARALLGSDIEGRSADAITPGLGVPTDLVDRCAEGWSRATIDVTVHSEPRQMEVDCARIDDDFVLLLLRDVTEIEAAMRRIDAEAGHQRAIAQELTRLDELRRTFLLTVAHDMRAPMAAIAGLAGLLQDHPELPEDHRMHLIRRIRETADWVVEQFADVLDVQRLESGHTALHPEPVDLRELIADATARADQGTHDLRHEVGATRAVVDKGITTRIIDNLLRNAQRHTPVGSHVVIRCSRDGSQLEIVVEDDGPGVPDDLAPRLFDLFQREHRAEGPEGLGVGLYLVRRLAQVHGGWATYEPRPGGGSRFTTCLETAD